MSKCNYVKQHLYTTKDKYIIIGSEKKMEIENVIIKSSVCIMNIDNARMLAKIFSFYGLI